MGMLLRYVAHAGETHTEEAVQTGLIDSLMHQPAWLNLLLVGAALFAVYTLLEKLKIKPLNRVLLLIPVLLALAVLYMADQPIVATVLVSTGFLLSFALAFTMLTGPKKP